MSAIFQGICAKLNAPKQIEPIKDIRFAEILYADDTLLFGTHTHTINKFLHEVQQESGKYNMNLNLDKCVNITISRRQSSIKFLDGTAVPGKLQALYLRATLTDSVDNHAEVMKRIGAVPQHCSSPGGSNIGGGFVAALNFKVMYRLESIQLTKSDTRNSFQMKMLRRIRVPGT